MSQDHDEPQLSSDAEEAVRQTLRALPRPEIPAEVDARVMDAIRAEALARQEMTGASSGAAEARARSKWRVLAPLAVAAVIGLIALAALPGFLTSPTQDDVVAQASCGVGVDANVDLSPAMMASGTSYSGQNLSNRAVRVARNTPVSCDPTSTVASRGSIDDDVTVSPDGSAPSDPASTRDTPAPQDPQDAVAVQAALADMFPTGDADQQMQSCVVKVVEGRRVEVVDVARYGGSRAAIVVVTEPREAWVLACGQPDPQILDRQQLASS